MKRKKTLRILLTVLVSLVLLLSVLAGGFLLWSKDAYAPSSPALAAMKSSDRVKVTDSTRYVLFEPTVLKSDEMTTTGLIFYPGGKVEPEAYAPLLSAVAAAGHPVVLCRMPLNLAVFATNAADGVPAPYSAIRWAIGGHSLGGSMAAFYSYKHPGKVAGLVLLGSYPAESNDFSGTTLPVLSIYGTNDMGVGKIRQSRTLLPEATTWLELSGGNHAQFGDYGPQKGDGTATLSRESQQNLAVESITAFLSRLPAE